MNKLIMILATGFYSGLLPKAPGTWGSLVAILLWLPLRGLSLPHYLLMLLLVFILGFLVAGTAEKLMNRPDAGAIVIDEILGMFITLMFAPNHPMAWFIGFIFFRIFDIWKPAPVSWFDQHMHGGLGIMLDDVMAGIYALASLQLFWFFFGDFLI
ncbi:phosphatidylglycerophosphatase A family protein [Desulfotalea psychrophila]|uniref:Related to phosphatidylglycerophosphatase A n=1 Tax=Desulfotalea psychrophila (strain LSv54 / DSM 12343) TaxID=177439 RepID=Q6AQ95_DESPS|nr:phosphatidylglycerophosphatase A [Desulfotalea psychrophila]CAG35478.1 related to phosphatidylglycerophosphatase A [Desulfotalea psychrophila LSv54]